MLPDRCAFNPDAPLDELLAQLPARWCVYLLLDADDRPVQLLCVKNLRASVGRRLGERSADEGLTKTVDYRAVVRAIAWQRVDSDFEQDVLYLRLARTIFPDTYRAVLGFRPAWWIGVDVASGTPRFEPTAEPTETGRYFGPLPDKQSARKLVHHLEDLFDLCRDPAALAAAPAGPCQWKQMNKCVGPCDGSIGLDAYRAVVAHAADVLADPRRELENQDLRMRHAALEQNFETAARIKAFHEKLGRLTEGNWRNCRPLSEFAYLAVLPGPGSKSAVVLGVRADAIEELARFDAPVGRQQLAELLNIWLGRLERTPSSLDTESAETASLVTHHLFPSRKTPGVLLHRSQIDEREVAAALRAVTKRKADEETTEEGEVRGIGL